MQKVVHGKAPQYLKDLMIPSERLRVHENKQLLPKTRIDIFKTSFSFSGSLAWNSLPHHLRYPMEVKTFERKAFRALTKPPRYIYIFFFLFFFFHLADTLTHKYLWAAMRSHFNVSVNCEGQRQKTVSTDHNFWRERRAEAESGRTEVPLLTSKDSTLRKDSACGNLRWNGSQLALPSGYVVQNGVQQCSTWWHRCAVLCCSVLVLGTWRLVSCSLWSWGCLSMSVFIPLLCSVSKAQSKNAQTHCSNIVHIQI